MGVGVEDVEDRSHPGMQLSDRAVVIAQLPDPSLLAAVSSGALQVADHVEDVDHVVAGVGGERVGVGQQRGDPPFVGQIRQLGDPGLIGVAGQRRHPPGGQTAQVHRAGAERADLGQPLEGPCCLTGKYPG